MQSNARVFCSQRAKAALALVVRRETLGFSVLQFWQFFRSVFRFLCQKTSVFRFWCSFRFVDFSFFSTRFSVFVENNSAFSVLLSNVVFGFSYFESKGLITCAGLVSVCRDLGTFVKRNKTQLRDYMTTGPARLAEISVSWCRDPG